MSVKIINPNALGITQESPMEEHQRDFASRTMTLCAKDVKSDEVWNRWLLFHFRWSSAMCTSSKIDFETMRAFNIDMRTKYHFSPFVFDPTRWQSDLTFFIQQREVQFRKELQEAQKGRQVFSNSNNSTSSSYSADSSKNKKPFQSGQAGGNSSRTPTCPICLTKGHKFRDCRVLKRVDGKALYAKASGDRKGLLSITGGAVICLLWNILSKASSRCSTVHVDNPAAHRCAACSSPEHHTLSLTCLKKN
jgi:hypothetical protein